MDGQFKQIRAWNDCDVSIMTRLPTAGCLPQTCIVWVRKGGGEGDEMPEKYKSRREAGDKRATCTWGGSVSLRITARSGGWTGKTKDGRHPYQLSLSPRRLSSGNTGTRQARRGGDKRRLRSRDRKPPLIPEGGYTERHDHRAQRESWVTAVNLGSTLEP